MTIYCPACGKQILQDSVFCTYCGTAIKIPRPRPESVQRQQAQEPNPQTSHQPRVEQYQQPPRTKQTQRQYQQPPQQQYQQPPREHRRRPARDFAAYAARNKKRVITFGAIGIGVVAVVVLLAVWLGGRSGIEGKWFEENTDNYIVLLSDGTLETNIHSKNRPDTWELLDDGLFKWGIWDAGFIQYDYTYFETEITRDKLTLTPRDSSFSFTFYREGAANAD